MDSVGIWRNNVPLSLMWGILLKKKFHFQGGLNQVQLKNKFNNMIEWEILAC